MFTIHSHEFMNIHTYIFNQLKIQTNKN